MEQTHCKTHRKRHYVRHIERRSAETRRQKYFMDCIFVHLDTSYEW